MFNLLGIGEDRMIDISHPLLKKGQEPIRAKLLDINMFAGVGKIECPDCNGSGMFWITDEDCQSCVLCKTRGWINVSLF